MHGCRVEICRWVDQYPGSVGQVGLYMSISYPVSIAEPGRNIKTLARFFANEQAHLMHRLRVRWRVECIRAERIVTGGAESSTFRGKKVGDKSCPGDQCRFCWHSALRTFHNHHLSLVSGDN